MKAREDLVGPKSSGADPDNMDPELADYNLYGGKFK